jgi:hypothetical protein
MGAVQAAGLEALVLDEVRRLVDGLRVGVGEQTALLEARERRDAERAALQAKIEKLQGAMTDADADFYAELLPRERHERVTARLSEQLNATRARLAEFADPDDASVSVVDTLAAAERVLTEWDDATPDDRRALLRAARLRKVTVRASKRMREPVSDRTEVVFDL